MDDEEKRHRRKAQQIVDAEEKPRHRALRVCSSDGYRPSEHTRWHMEHRPYQTATRSRQKERGK